MSYFDDRAGVALVLVFAALAYAALVAALRVSGKRTLAKMNAFDLAVTVAQSPFAGGGARRWRGVFGMALSFESQRREIPRKASQRKRGKTSL